MELSKGGIGESSARTKAIVDAATGVVATQAAAPAAAAAAGGDIDGRDQYTLGTSARPQFLDETQRPADLALEGIARWRDLPQGQFVAPGDPLCFIGPVKRNTALITAMEHAAAAHGAMADALAKAIVRGEDAPLALRASAEGAPRAADLLYVAFLRGGFGPPTSRDARTGLCDVVLWVRLLEECAAKAPGLIVYPTHQKDCAPVRSTCGRVDRRSIEGADGDQYLEAVMAQIESDAGVPPGTYKVQTAREALAKMPRWQRCFFEFRPVGHPSLTWIPVGQEHGLFQFIVREELAGGVQRWRMPTPAVLGAICAAVTPSRTLNEAVLLECALGTVNSGHLAGAFHRESLHPFSAYDTRVSSNHMKPHHVSLDSCGMYAHDAHHALFASFLDAPARDALLGSFLDAAEWLEKTAKTERVRKALARAVNGFQELEIGYQVSAARTPVERLKLAVALVARQAADTGRLQKAEQPKLLAILVMAALGDDVRFGERPRPGAAARSLLEALDFAPVECRTGDHFRPAEREEALRWWTAACGT